MTLPAAVQLTALPTSPSSAHAKRHSHSSSNSTTCSDTSVDRPKARYSIFPPVFCKENSPPPTTITEATAVVTSQVQGPCQPCKEAEAAAKTISPSCTTDTTASTASTTSTTDGRASRFHEQMNSPPSEASTANTTTAPAGPTDVSAPSPSSYKLASPAPIPLRTSSTKAVANGDHSASGSASGTRLSPKHQSNLSSVPEGKRASHIDQRTWMAGEGKNHSHRVTASSASFPLSFDKQSPTGIVDDLIDGHGVSWSTEKENILKGPFVYLEAHPGKDIRSQLINAFNTWLQVPPSSLEVITRVVAMLHTASLLIDDVEDNSQLRRGIPVAHSIFGTAQTINSANYVYFCALQELLTLNNPEVIRIYTEELLNLHRGQGMDLFWRDTLTCPTEDDYLEMVGNKTGGLFRLAIKLMCAESPTHNRITPESSSAPYQPTDYLPLVNTVGLLFQILDDYRNLSDTVYTQNKGLCEDLTEGKFSFPIIHAIRSDPSNLVLINILKQKTTDDEVKRYAVAYMERCGSFSYTRRVLRGLTKKALALVDVVDAGQGKGEGIKGILERLRVDKQHSRASHST